MERRNYYLGNPEFLFSLVTLPVHFLTRLMNGYIRAIFGLLRFFADVLYLILSSALIFQLLSYLKVAVYKNHKFMVVALGGKSSESFPGLTRILPLYEEANELEASFQTQTFHLHIFT